MWISVYMIQSWQIILLSIDMFISMKHSPSITEHGSLIVLAKI